MLDRPRGRRSDVVLEAGRSSDDEVVRRLSGRRTCRGCGKIWHIIFDAPTHEGVCDRCGSELYQRDDDKADTVAERLRVYARDTSPLVIFYGAQGRAWVSTNRTSRRHQPCGRSTPSGGLRE